MSYNNILIVDELCYPMLGGAQLRLKLLAECWVEQGHQVTVVAIDHLGNLPETEVLNGVLIIRLLKDADYYKNGLLGRKFSTILRFTMALRAFANANNADKYNIVIFNQFPILPAIFSRFLFPKSLRILDFVEYRSSLVWKAINTVLVNSTNKVICISRDLQSKVKLHRKSGVHYMPNAVKMPLSSNSYIEKEGYVFLGRLETHKHPEDAIKAIIYLHEKLSHKCTLTIVGDGQQYEYLRKEYASFPQILFLGRVDDETKNKIMSTSRILILPSEREGLPNVVLEAIANGMPVVTTIYPDNGTQHFVSEYKIGLVAKPTIEDIADKILQIESDYSSFHTNCLNSKENFNVFNVSKKYLLLVAEQ